MDAAPRRLKKRNRKEFEDTEAVEQSDDSDIEAETACARGSEVLPREVAQLQQEMDARENVGTRGYAANLASMEEHYLREHRADLAAAKEEEDMDDFLIPEADVKVGKSAVKSPSQQDSLPSPKQRKLDTDEDSRSRKSGAGGSGSHRSRMHDPIDSAHKTLPTSSDPKLWRVKCFKSGYEKEFCANLINKFSHMVQTQGDSYLQEIPIYSIFAADAAKGYIYVEAHREIDVRNYIKGIRALGAWNIHLVPTKEMIGVFNMASFVESQSKGNVRPGSWVRLTRGIYRHDVAVVLRVFDGSLQVRIKPRVNFENEASGKKPRQEFFSLETCKALPHVSITNARKKVSDIACFEVGGETYTCDSGHLIKTVSKTGFNTDCQTTLAEEEAFSNPLAPEAYSKDFAPGADAEQGLRQVYRRNKDAVRGGTRQKRFFKGERVRVKTGQLSGLHCKVVEVLPNDVLRLEAEYASAEWKRLNGIESGLIEYPCDMVEKYFEMGNRVKILGGEHTGETGTISSVMEKDRCCTVVSETMENERGFPIEFKVSTWDLTCTTEKKTTKVEYYGFKIGDLVSGPGKMVGIVTSLGRNTLRVLTEQGLSRDWSYKQMSLEKRFTDRPPESREKMNDWVLDRRGQRICRMYQVTVCASAQRRRMVGTVVHLVRESTSGAERVFVHDNMTLGEEKYVIALARECETRTATPPMSSYESQKMAFAAIGDEERLKEIECDTSDLPKRSLLKQGRRVQIVSGPYKGLLAEVRSEIDEHYVRVQLLIKPKMMQVHKRTIQFCDMRAGGNMLEDLPPAVPPTPLPAEVDDENDADPWDMRFKLPAPVRKKAEIAWDPTYRKTKLVQRRALPAPASEQLEDDIASHHTRDLRRTKNETPDPTLPEPKKLLELMDSAELDEFFESSTFQSAVDISMDELLSNPVPIE